MARTTRSSTSKADAASIKTEAAAPAIATAPKKQQNRKSKITAAKAENQAEKPTVPANTSRKRARSPVKAEPSATPEPKEEPDATSSPKRAKTTSKSKATKPEKPTSTPKAKPKSKSTTKPPPQPDLTAGAKVAASITGTTGPDPEATASSPEKKSKANPYQLTGPGISPYPTYAKPTPADCREVHDALASIHGTVTAPTSIAAPSLNSSGCGEVPSVLDALVRTRLSAATNGANSSRAFRGLVDYFGLLKEGTGKGSVDWMKVHRSDVKEVFECIKSGGLADVKSRDIKKILQLVYDENAAQASEEGPKDSKKKRDDIKVLSLDHLHSLPSDAAFQKLLTYPGIGPKTASCVLLFCMQRPSFAVDTHVFRLTRWLGWTPSDAEVKRMGREAKAEAEREGKEVVDADEEGESVGEGEGEGEDVKEEDPPATPAKSKGKGNGNGKAKIKPPPPVGRNTTYAHLDIRIPDELKYPLHYLLIKHGKTCPECTAKADKKVREEWGGKKCPIKHLKRGGGKKVVKKVEGEEVDDEENEGDKIEGEDENLVDGEEGGEGEGEGEKKELDPKKEYGIEESLHGIERQMVL